MSPTCIFDGIESDCIPSVHVSKQVAEHRQAVEEAAAQQASNGSGSSEGGAKQGSTHTVDPEDAPYEVCTHTHTHTHIPSLLREAASHL